MPPIAHIATQLKDAIGVILLAGEITSEIEQPFLRAYTEVTAAGAKKILLKFDSEYYINSAGIALIIMVVGQARDAGQRVGVVGLTPHYQKIFEMIGLTDYLTLYQGEDTAFRLL